jgi:hypothetical protein
VRLKSNRLLKKVIAERNLAITKLCRAEAKSELLETLIAERLGNMITKEVFDGKMLRISFEPLVQTSKGAPALH